jgi:hypothetical protein
MEWMTELAMDRSSRSDSSGSLVEGFRAVYEADVALELTRSVRLAQFDMMVKIGCNFLGWAAHL